MTEIINEHEAARRLGLPVEEVVYRLDYSQMAGCLVNGAWQFDARWHLNTTPGNPHVWSATCPDDWQSPAGRSCSTRAGPRYGYRSPAGHP